MYLHLNCFLYASTFLSISFFIITSLSISVACFSNSLTFSRKCDKSISFETKDSLFIKLPIASFSISCSTISILSRFSLAIPFRFFSSFSFSISRFSIFFFLSIFSSFYLSISFITSLGFDIFVCVKKKIYISLHIL